MLKAKTREVPPQELVQKSFRRDEIITISEFDMVPPIMPQSDVVVMSLIVANHEVRRVYANNGAVVSILFWDCFQRLGIKKENLKSCSVLQSFN